jgi:hypothetical protein
MSDKVESVIMDLKTDDKKFLKDAFANVEKIASDMSDDIEKLAGRNSVRNSQLVPEITSPDWTDYILKQFGEDELIEGNPTLDGLRRICNKYLGTVIRSVSKVIVPPSFENNYSAATVQHKIVILWTKDVEAPIKKVFQEVADVNESNTDPEYRVFASATASSRAEGRCYRKMLCLRRVIAAEEITTVAPPQNNDEGPKTINLSQKNFIKTLCNRLKMSVKKFANMGKQKYEKLDQVPYQVAQKMIGALNSYQRNNNPPDSIKLGPDEENNDKDFS